MLRYCLLLSAICMMPVLGRAQNHARFSDIKAGMHDYDMEHEALRVANKKAANMRCREDFTKVVIVSDKWEKVYDDMGMLDGRIIHTELYGETWDGHCGSAHAVFFQKYEHEYLPRLSCLHLDDFYDMECE